MAVASMVIPMYAGMNTTGMMVYHAVLKPTLKLT